MASIARGYPDPGRRDRPLGAQVPAAGAADPDRKAFDDAHLRHQGGLQLCAALRARHPGSGGDGADGTRQLPRLRAADDGGGALARARGAIRVGLSLRSVTRSLRRGRRPCRRATWRRQHVGGGSTHAWCQVYLPGAGWVEFDPTNGIIGNRDLIRVAVARDPSQAIPLSGTYAGSPDDELGMKVQVHVTREEDAGD